MLLIVSTSDCTKRLCGNNKGPVITARLFVRSHVLSQPPPGQWPVETLSTTLPVCIKNSAASFVCTRACYVRYIVRPLVLKFKVIGDKDITTKILDFDVICKICFYSQHICRYSNLLLSGLGIFFYFYNVTLSLNLLSCGYCLRWLSCFNFPKSLKGSDTNDQCDDLLFTSAYHSISRKVQLCGGTRTPLPKLGISPYMPPSSG